uniref:hypothetical protein n=1 Tax=unclassified Variovorax TaxID=663243 RepID=UPI000DA12971
MLDIENRRHRGASAGLADVDLDQAAFSAGAAPVRLEKAVPKSASQEFALLEMSTTNMRSTERDLPGRRVDYVASRVQQVAAPTPENLTSEK